MKHHRCITKTVAPAQSTIEVKMTFLVNLVDQAIVYVFQKTDEL